ncbi:MAG: LysM peptidoglycan-binding domain-containing protein, partial [Gammaproteobacteria bacterium]
RNVQVAEKRSPKVEPQALPTGGTYRVRRGDTIDRIARRYGMTPKELQAMNNIRNKNKIYPGQRLVLAKLEGDTYIVRRGDSIERIAKRTGKNAKQLLALNNIRNKNRIYPGQKLILDKSSEPDEPKELKLPKTEDPFPSNSDQNDKGEVIVAKASDKNLPDVNNVIKIPTSAAANAAESKPTEQSIEQSKNQLADETIVVADEEENTTSEKAETENSNSSKSPSQLANISPEVLGIAVNPADEKDDASSADEENIDASGESIGDAAISESDTELLADPTDYSVSKRNTIEVQAAETLGHYAEWLQLRASDLRRVNRMRYGKPVVVGKRIKLKFTKVTPEEFEEQRIAYHRALQEEFFEQYQITGSDKHKIRRGQSVWKLTKRTYKIPLWLLRQYNPDLNMNKVRPGTIITFPKIEQRTEDSKPVQPGSAGKTVASKAATS